MQSHTYIHHETVMLVNKT